MSAVPRYSVVPFQGVRVDLAPFHILAAGDRTLFSLRDQVVSIAPEFDEFLAPVEHDPEAGQAFFRFPGGRHFFWSRALRLRRVPTRDLEELRRGAARLAETLDCQQGPRHQALSGFRLPDPDTNPQMYRINGLLRPPRLMILWGCERQPGSSLKPREAVERLQTYRDPVPAGVRPFLACLLGILLLGLIGVGTWKAAEWWRGQPDLGRRTEIAAGSTDQQPGRKDGQPPERDLQYLTVTPTNAGVMDVITASSRGEGSISFGNAREEPVAPGEKASHAFAEPGRYPVRWKPTQTGRHPNDEVRYVKITPVVRDGGVPVATESVIANLEIWPTEVRPGETVEAHARASFYNGRPNAPAKPLKYRLLWGDGSQEIELELPRLTAKHRYRSTGEYPVRLRVATDDGKEDRSEKSVFVGIADPKRGRIVAWLEIINVDTEKREVTLLLDGRIIGGDKHNRLVSCTLDWGDGERIEETEQVPPLRQQHRYKEARRYTISGFCRDNLGRRSRVEKWVCDFSDAGGPGVWVLPSKERGQPVGPDTVSVSRGKSEVESRREGGARTTGARGADGKARKSSPAPTAKGGRKKDARGKRAGKGKKPLRETALKIDCYTKNVGKGRMDVVLFVVDASDPRRHFKVTEWRVNGKHRKSGNAESLTLTFDEGDRAREIAAHVRGELWIRCEVKSDITTKGHVTIRRVPANGRKK